MKTTDLENRTSRSMVAPNVPLSNTQSEAYRMLMADARTLRARGELDHAQRTAQAAFNMIRATFSTGE